MTKLEIINAALIQAGGERLETLESSAGKAAKTALAQFDITWPLLMRSHQWNFATTRAEIESDAVPPEFGYDNCYTLPEDYLRLSNLYDKFNVAYRVESGKILTDLGSPLALVYVRKVTDPEEWDVMFANAVASDIASKIAFSVTANLQLAGTLDTLAERTLVRAKWADSTENSAIAVTALQWIVSRYGLKSSVDRFHSITATEEPFPS